MTVAEAGVPVASVNGVVLHTGDGATAGALRQRVCVELLRQAAERAGLDTRDVPRAIEQWLDRTLHVDEPSDEACRRHYEARAARYRDDERLTLRHILFAVTPGVNVAALRGRAEALLVELRASDLDDDAFAAAARRWSNCPSGAAGGALGTLARRDCAGEFAREVFGGTTVGVLPRLVHSRFGLHIVAIVARDPGRARPFSDVEPAIRQALRQQAWTHALRRLLQELAAHACIEGIGLDEQDVAFA